MTSTLALRCPKCAGEMATYERSGIMLDQCRECRGIFLDRGELERMVDAEGGAWIGPRPGVPTGVTHAAPPPTPLAGHPAMRVSHRTARTPRHDDRDRTAYSSEWSIDIDSYDRDDPRSLYGPGAGAAPHTVKPSARFLE